MNIIAPQTPFGYTIFCDDVRVEITGKNIFIGVYNGVVMLTQLPALVPSLYAIVRYTERKGESSDPVVIKVFEPENDMPIISIDVPVDEMRATVIPEGLTDDPMVTAMIPIAFMPFQFEKEGFIKVRAYRGDDEIRLGSLRVQLAPQNGMPLVPPPQPPQT